MNRPVVWVLAVVGVVTALPACVTASRLLFTEPEISLARVDVADVSVTGGTLRLHLDARNPNSYAIRAGRLSVEVALEGTRFGTAALESLLDLAAGAVTPVVIPLSFNWQGVGAAARALLDRGSVAYEIAGELTAGTPLGELPVRIRQSGQASLTRQR